MTIGLYFLSFVLGIVAINIWSKEAAESADDAQGPTLLAIIAAASGLTVLVLLVGGFFVFSWFIPLVALAVSLIAGTAGAMLARKGGGAAGLGVACGLASVGLAAAVTYLTVLI